MFCANCGKELDQDSKFCANCGAFVEVSQGANNNAYAEVNTASPYTYAGVGASPAENISLKEFYNRYASKNTKSWTTAMVVISFITAGLSLILMFLDGFSYVLDAAFYGTMGGLLLAKRNWLFALIPTVYSGVFSLLYLATEGTMSGVFALIAGVMSTIALKKLHNAYKAYQKNNIPPHNLI